MPAWIPEAVDMAVVARRARLKAEACRWAMERRKRTKDGTWGQVDIQDGYQSLIVRAKQLPNCYLWMLNTNQWLPPDLRLEEIAASFDNLALGVEIELSTQDDNSPDDDFRSDLMSLMAECQSALRATLLEMSDPVEDRDQRDAHYWLKTAAGTRQVFIRRHMRLDDPASPADWYERGRRLAAMQEARSLSQRSARERTQGFNKLRFHARRIEAAVLGNELPDDWLRIFETVDKLFALGVKASSKELRDLVIMIADRLPDDMPVSEGWKKVDRHIDEYLALQEAEHTEQAPLRQRSTEVEAAAKLLRGLRVVLIGGQERPRSKDALVRELELGELKWITCDDHESLDSFEPDISHPKTDIVILMIRWTSHSYGGVKKFCDDHGKLLVRLPRGYSPNQVAVEVLKQVGDRLRRRNSGEA